MIKQIFIFIFQTGNLSQIQSLHINDCDCLPQCSDVNYEIVTESIPMDNAEFDSEIT